MIPRFVVWAPGFIIPHDREDGGEDVRWEGEDKEKGEYNFGPAHLGKEVQ